MHSKMPFKPMGKNSPKISPSPCQMLTPSNMTVPQPTPLTIPNGHSIASRTFTQVRNKIPISYNGTPHIPPKLRLPFDRSLPI